MEEEDTLFLFSYTHTRSSEFMQRSTKWQQIEISTPDNIDRLMIILAHRLGWDDQRTFVIT